MAPYPICWSIVFVFIQIRDGVPGDRRQDENFRPKNGQPHTRETCGDGGGDGPVNIFD